MKRRTGPQIETKNVMELPLHGRLRGIFSSSTKMKIFPRPRWRWVLPAVLAALLLGLGSAGLILWRAQRALRIATTEVQSEESLPFSVRKLVTVNTSFEWISAPDAFASAAFFKGDLYVCGA